MPDFFEDLEADEAARQQPKKVSGDFFADLEADAGGSATAPTFVPASPPGAFDVPMAAMERIEAPPLRRPPEGFDPEVASRQTVDDLMRAEGGDRTDSFLAAVQQRGGAEVMGPPEPDPMAARVQSARAEQAARAEARAQADAMAAEAERLAVRLGGMDPAKARARFRDASGAPLEDEALSFLRQMDAEIQQFEAKAGGDVDLYRVGRAIDRSSPLYQNVLGEGAVAWFEEAANIRRARERGEGFWGGLKTIALDTAPGLPRQIAAVAGGSMLGGPVGGAAASGLMGAEADPENRLRGAVLGMATYGAGSAASRYLAPAGSGMARVAATEVGGNVAIGAGLRAATGQEYTGADLAFDVATGLGGAAPRMAGFRRRGPVPEPEVPLGVEAGYIPPAGEVASTAPVDVSRLGVDLATVRERYPKMPPEEQEFLAREIANQRAFEFNRRQPSIERRMRILDPEIAAEEQAQLRMREDKMVDLPPAEAREAEAALQQTAAEVDYADDIGRRIERAAAMPADRMRGLQSTRAERVRQRGMAGQVSENSMVQFFARWSNAPEGGAEGGRRALMTRFGISAEAADGVIQQAVSRGLVAPELASMFAPDPETAGARRRKARDEAAYTEAYQRQVAPDAIPLPEPELTGPEPEPASPGARARQEVGMARIERELTRRLLADEAPRTPDDIEALRATLAREMMGPDDGGPPTPPPTPEPPPPPVRPQEPLAAPERPPEVGMARGPIAASEAVSGRPVVSGAEPAAEAPAKPARGMGRKKPAKAAEEPTIAPGAGARKHTKAGLARANEAREMLRAAINNPDLVGAQRADTIANLRNLVGYLDANGARDTLDTGVEFGDRVAYTGEDAPPGMRAFIFLEGAKAGKYGVAPTPEARAASVAQDRAEWADQQAQFRRLREPDEPAKGMGSKRKKAEKAADVPPPAPEAEPAPYRKGEKPGMALPEGTLTRQPGESVPAWQARVAAAKADRARRMGGERGSAMLPDISPAAERVGMGVSGMVDLARRTVSYFFQPLKDRLARLPSGAAYQQIAERALDASTRFTRVMGADAEAPMKALNNTPEARRYIEATPQPGAPSPLMEALEGRAPRGEGVSLIRAYLDKAMGLFHRTGFLREDGSPVPESSPAAPRLNHADGLELLRSGRWRKSGLVRDTAQMPRNAAAGITEERITKHFEELEKRLNSDGPEAAEVAVALESRREIPDLPGWTSVGGKTVQFLENNPFRYMQRIFSGQAARFGFGATAGQGPDSPVNAWQGSLDKQAREVLRDFTRAFHGAPLEDPLVLPGDKAEPLVRAAGSLVRIFKAAALTMNAIKNVVPEILGGASAQTGRLMLNLKAMRNLLLDYRGVVDRLEGQGVHGGHPTDRTIDPSRPVTENIDRAARMIQAFGTTWGENIQKAFAGEKALLTVQEAGRGMARGGAAEAEVRAFRDLTNATPEQLDAMRRGDLSARDFEDLGFQFIRRMVQETQGSNMSGAQKSRAQHSRILKALTAFTNFSTMYQYKAAKRLTTGGIDLVTGVAKGNFRQAVGGADSILRVLAGTALMNGSATLIGALLYGGPERLRTKANELGNNPLGFAMDSLMAGLTSGYAGAFLKATGQGDGINAFFPAHLTNQFLNLVGLKQSEAAYKGKGFFGRLNAFLSRTTPLYASFEGGLLSMPWSDENRRQLRTAKSAFWEFYRERGYADKGMARTDFSDWDDAMQRVADMVIAGVDNPEEMAEAVADAAALGTNGRDSVSRSLESKRLLPRLKPEDAALLQSSLRADDWEALVAHDAALARAARSFKGWKRRR